MATHNLRINEDYFRSIYGIQFELHCIPFWISRSRWVRVARSHRWCARYRRPTITTHRVVDRHHMQSIVRIEQLSAHRSYLHRCSWLEWLMRSHPPEELVAVKGRLPIAHWCPAHEAGSVVLDMVTLEQAVPLQSYLRIHSRLRYMKCCVLNSKHGDLLFHSWIRIAL